MKKVIKYVAIGIAALTLIVVGVFNFFPDKIIEITNSNFANAANLERKVITINGYPIHYFESETIKDLEKENQKDVLVLLHGMGDDKNSFLQSANKLSEHYHLILPDLAGHGENRRDTDFNYSINGQVEFVHGFLKELNVERFNLVGNSMGGHTAATYAIKYPEQVKSLVLLNAAGLKLDDHIVYTGFGKRIETEQDFHALLSRVFYKIPDMPSPIQNHLMEQINNSKDFVDNTLVPSIKNGQFYNLKNKVNDILSPTLVLWGKHDKVIKFNAAEYFQQAIPVSKLQVIEKAGHSPQLEVPDEVADAIHAFIQQDKSDLIKSTQLSHAAKAQYYRWYLFYERDFENQQRLDNQMEILSEDVKMKSAAGEMQGRDQYPARLKVFKGWKNAHHVQTVNVNSNENGVIDLHAEITYQNVKPDGSNDSYKLKYDTQLAELNSTGLPVFKQITITPIGVVENPTFEDAYPKNRVLSLIHYWLYNMEQLDGNVEPFKELLADNFKLNFSTSNTSISSIAELGKWLNDVPKKQLTLSSHVVKNLKVKEVSSNQYEISVEFVWRGISKDNKALMATTLHQWQVVDNPNDRFAKIKEMKVSQKAPLMMLN